MFFITVIFFYFLGALLAYDFAGLQSRVLYFISMPLCVVALAIYLCMIPELAMDYLKKCEMWQCYHFKLSGIPCQLRKSAFVKSSAVIAYSCLSGANGSLTLMEIGTQ